MRMRYLKASNALAENIRRKLRRSGLIERQETVEHSDSYVYFPLISISRARVKKVIGSGTRFYIIEKATKNKERKPRNYREALKEILTEKERDMVSGGYDILGNIAILDIPKELGRKERALARAILDMHPSISTVIAKDSAVKGRYRTRRFRHILGKKDYIAAYKENGCTFRFDVRKTFFSNRLSYERARLTSMAKDNETVVVMFAGIGPFGIEIAKAHPSSRVICVELNPYAAKAAIYNVAINKTDNVEVLEDDVRIAAGKLKGKANRIIVPMPTSSLEFLDEISTVAGEGAVVHLYAFCSDAQGPEGAISKISEHAAVNGYAIEVLSARKARPYSSRESEMVIDYRISKKRKRKGTKTG